jgi:Carboxypeptidase regulatory-like domain
MKAPQPQKARVEGVVLDASNGKLLSGAQVTLKPVQPSDALRIRLVDPEAVRLATRKRTTGADGVFRFDDVEPGRYRIHVVCNGYARSEYGQRSDGQGTTLTFTSGQVISGLNVSLRAASIVTGRVCESSGKPAPGLLVSLLKVCFNSRGLRTLENSGTAITDDRGEYRIVWVSPGRYYLGVQSPTETTSRVLCHINVVERTSLPVTYHPGVLDWSNATVFDLPAATEVRATDLVLTETPTFSIKGTVVDKRPVKRAGTPVFLCNPAFRSP